MKESKLLNLIVKINKVVESYDDLIIAIMIALLIIFSITMQ